jgi:hypothetical protein
MSQLRDTKSLGPPCLAIQWLFAVRQSDEPGTPSNAIGDETSGTRSVSPGRQEELRQLAKSKPAGNGAEWDPERGFASGRIGEIFAKPGGLCETDAETEKSLKRSRKSGEREERENYGKESRARTNVKWRAVEDWVLDGQCGTRCDPERARASCACVQRVETVA